MNEAFFDDIATEAQAYWLGFLYADGCPSRGIVVGLALVDGPHLEWMRRDFGAGHPVRYSRAATLNLCSNRLGERFRELRAAAFVPALTHHFVRGVFDGDGCAHQTRRGYYGASIAGTRPLVEKIGRLARTAGVEKARITKHSKPGSPTWIWEVTTAAGVCAFRDWIYEDASVFLARKRAILDGAAVIASRPCQECGELFQPRYSGKGAFCSRRCYMRVYYRWHPEKWK